MGYSDLLLEQHNYLTSTLARLPAVLFFTLLCSTSLLAQSGVTYNLFELKGKTTMLADNADHIRHKWNISVNQNITQADFLRENDRLRVQLIDSTYEFRIKRISRYTDNTVSIIAQSDIHSGDILTFTMQKNRIKGMIHKHRSNKIFSLTWSNKTNSNYLASVDISKVNQFECPVGPELFVGNKNRLSRNQYLGKTSSPAVKEKRATVDIILSYTVEAQNAMNRESSVELVLSEAINKAQMSLDISNVLLDLNVVHTTPAYYAMDRDSALFQLTDPQDGIFDEIHTIRDQYAADIVALIAGTRNQGWLLTTPNGRPEYAFNTVHYVGLMPGNNTLAHELGHNFGSHHGRNQLNEAAPDEGGLYEYSTGWVWSGNDGNRYSSVMHYGTIGPRENPKHARDTFYYSNPDISYKGAPTGSYNGPAAPADNARSINEIRHVLASYRNLLPALKHPQEGERGISTQPTLRWTNTDATEYQIQVSSSPGFSSVMLDAQRSDTTFYIADELEHLKYYYWRVRGKTDKRTGQWSSGNFQTKIGPPSIIQPVNGAIQVSLEPTLIWSRNDQASGYQVEIAENSNFDVPEVRESTEGPTYTVDSPLTPATNYQWRVRAVYKSSYGQWSEVQEFTTRVEETELEVIYPNPFRNTTTIQYHLAERSNVILELYDNIGRKVRTLQNSDRDPRIHRYQLDATDLASGVYVVRLITGNKSDIAMITLIQ